MSRKGRISRKSMTVANSNQERPRLQDPDAPVTGLQLNTVKVTNFPQIPTTIDPSHAKQFVAEGHMLTEKRQFVEAERCFRTAIKINPLLPFAHNNLGFVRQAQGDLQTAIYCYQVALKLDPSMRLALANMLKALTLCKRFDEALRLIEERLAIAPGDPQFLDMAVEVALEAGRLELAGNYALRHAIARSASRWYPKNRPDDPRIIPLAPPEFSAAKLRHDIEQLQYLAKRKVLDHDFQPTITYYERFLEDLTAFSEDQRFSLNSQDEREVGGIYGRLVHMRSTPRLARAVSNAWNSTAVENKYINEPPGIVWIDNFLTEEALRSLRDFCLESTIWSVNRYTNGYLGAFFREGFNCPLLIQIGEELQQALPRIIGKLPLLQMWGYKYDATMKGIATHADFAAINVNFWITPDDANLDPESGGLVVHDVEAPLDWNFSTYNDDIYTMQALIEQNKARSINIPYRQNRAVIFNSDLFHATAPFKFRPGYENRRINITMLYGIRDMDAQRQRS